MNKKGFTLIEMLAVIVIIGILGTIAFVSSTTIAKKNREKMYESKIESIKAAAILYVEDRNYFENRSANNVTVKELAKKGYVTKDKDCKPEGCYTTDPRDNNKTLDNCRVKVEMSSEYHRLIATVRNCEI